MAGGEGAPDLQETLQNFAINSAAVAVFGFIFNRDINKQRSDKATIEREESLARLQVCFCCRLFSLVKDWVMERNGTESDLIWLIIQETTSW